MAPAPTLHNQDRTEGNGPRLQIMRHGPRLGAGVLRPFSRVRRSAGYRIMARSGRTRGKLRPGGLVQFWCGLPA